MTDLSTQAREMIERLEDGTKLSSVVNAQAVALIRNLLAEREAKAQQEYDAGQAFEEYGSAEEGACLYDLYAENRQFASQEPPKRNARGGWDYSV